jgi:hypothetical protein
VNGGAPFGDGLQHWLASAVTFKLDRVDTPLRIEAITKLSVLEEWEIYSSLTQQAKPVDLIYIPHGQHILQKPLERYASQQGNVDWFRFWLEDYEDSDPAKSQQYLRWRTLRGGATTTSSKAASNYRRSIIEYYVMLRSFTFSCTEVGADG